MKGEKLNTEITENTELGHVFMSGAEAPDMKQHFSWRYTPGKMRVDSLVGIKTQVAQQ